MEISERPHKAKGVHKVLVVGQTPPPYGGQAIMIEQMLRGSYTKVAFTHVRMAFSSEMDDIGRFKLSKLWHLLTLIVRIVYSRLKHKTRILYYPPAGPNRIPMYRDFVILICVRWMFDKTIFHFHAGGVSQLYQNLSSVKRFLFRAAYYKPAGSILLSELNPPDGAACLSKQEFIIPCGIPDHFPAGAVKLCHETKKILYVGVLKESKGVKVLLNALEVLANDGVEFEARLVGKFESKKFEEEVINRVSNTILCGHVHFPGVLIGDAKWNEYLQADLFVYPTFFESETFGLVVLEAMQFQLPTIVTAWRGVPSLVDDPKTGFVVPPQDASALAAKIKVLLQDTSLRQKMGQKARESYLQHFTSATFQRNIERAIIDIGEQA